MSVQLRHLRHAVALAEEGSYTAAANRLNLSQPALSRSIQALEEILGAKLFDRESNGVVPTGIGFLVVERGRVLLGGAHDLEREVQLALGLDLGSLSIGAGPYPTEISVGIACGRLALKHPRLSLDVRVGDWSFLLQLVLDGQLDIAIAELSTAEENNRLETEALPIHHGRFVCRAEHPLAAGAGLTLEDTFAYPLVTSSLPARLHKLRPSIRVDTFGLVRDIVCSSNALGLATSGQVEADLKRGALVWLPLELPWAHTNYGFIRLRGRTPSPAALAFMDEVRAAEKELA